MTGNGPCHKYLYKMQLTLLLLFTFSLVQHLHGRRISRSINDKSKSSQAINQFAGLVGQKISQNAPRTYLWSPFSVYQTLVPLCYSSEGETRHQLETILSTRGCPGQPQDESKSLSYMTGLFVQHGLPLNPQVIREIDRNVNNLHVDAVNFKENATLEINSWVKDTTGGMISHVADSIDPETVLMIVNCVKFDAQWAHPFSKELTKIDTFHGLQGPQQVKMMRQTGIHLFSSFITENSPENEISHEFSVLEMAYAEDNTAAIFVLPDNPAQLDSSLNYINKVSITGIRRALHWREVDLSLPRFRVTSDIPLEASLAEAGIPSIFTSEANLTKLFVNTTKSPSVSRIIHRTVFETSEKGTSATALSVISLIPLSALPQETHRIVFNKPFGVFIVAEDDTIIFQGVVNDLIAQNVDFEEPIDRAWWKPKKVPVYLTHNFTEDSSVPPPNTLENLAKEVSHLIKYQQPEPKDPSGIRFPARYIATNKFNPRRPRLINNLSFE